MAMNPTGNIPIWISPKIFILNPGGLGFEVRDEVVYPFYVPTDHTRIWFRNYLGHLDQVNFRMTEGTTKVTSQPKEKPLVVSPAGLNRNRTGQERMNVRSNDIKTVTGVFKEDQIAWLEELFAGSATFIEFHDGFAGDGGTPVATLIPIVIADAEFVSQKWDDDRYQYEVAVKYMMSNENIIVRN